MKKLTALILALVMVLSLAACGGSGNDSTKDSSGSGTPATSGSSDSGNSVGHG